MLRTIARTIHRTAARLNGVSASVVVFIMLLTCADVVMRLFGRPIPGTYELVGYFGAMIVAFALAWTSVERGHISVELLVDRLPARPRAIVEGAGHLASCVLFGLIAWQSQVYAMDLLENGEVSLTLGVPTWPFVFGLTAGCGMLALILFLDALRQLKRGLVP